MKYIELTDDVLKILDVLLDTCLKAHGKSALSIVDEFRKILDSAKTLEK